MSTLASGIALASSLVTSAVPVQEVSLEQYVSAQLQEQMIVMQHEFNLYLQNQVANSTHQFTLNESDAPRGTVSIKDIESNQSAE